MKEIKFTILYCVCENLCDSMKGGRVRGGGVEESVGSESEGYMRRGADSQSTELTRGPP